MSARIYLSLVATIGVLGGWSSVVSAGETQMDLGGNSEDYGNMGTSVAILSATRVIVGVPKDTNNAGTEAGSAWEFRWTGSYWSKTPLIDGAQNAYDHCGTSVAVQGDWALVGCPHHDLPSKNDAGAVLVFEFVSNIWVYRQKLTAGNYEQAYAEFGFSVDMDGTYAIVGSPLFDGSNQNEGRAVFFKRSGTPAQYHYSGLFGASSLAQGDRYGYAVGVSGSYFVVGSPYDDHSSLTNAGSVEFWRYHYSFPFWRLSREATIYADDPGAGDLFGLSVAIDGTWAVVGAPFEDEEANDAGAAYLIQRDGGTPPWDQYDKVTDSYGAASDRFGRSVAIDGEEILVGAFLDDESGKTNAGSATPFTHNPLTHQWDAGAKWVASDANTSDHFGFSVAISADLYLSGAKRQDNNGKTDSGSVYVLD